MDNAFSVLGDNLEVPAPERPRTDDLDIRTWIDRHETFGSAYMDAMRLIAEEMRARDGAMRDEVKIEGRMAYLLSTAILNGDEPTGVFVLANASNDKKRDAALTVWKHTNADYVLAARNLRDKKRERAGIEASIREKELACSVIKRDMEFGTAVMAAIARGATK